MKNLNNIILILIIFSISGCGVFNRVFKSSDKKKEDTEVKVNTSKNDVIVDKTTTKISEKVKTNINISGEQLESKTTLNNLSDLNGLVVLTSDLVTVRQSYDTLSKKLNTIVNLHPRVIPVDVEKTTIINNDITKKSNSKVDSTFNKTTVTKQQVKTKEPKNVIWYVVLGLGVLAVIYFISKKFI